jgi:hypothetical protein
MLTFAEAKTGSRRRDLVPEYSRPRLMDTKEESQKIKDFVQIVGIGSTKKIICNLSINPRVYNLLTSFRIRSTL